jgi:hypothetical protein
VRLLLILALAVPAPHQEGPYRRQIGEDGKTLVRFARNFDAMPKCMVRPDRVKIESSSREWVSLKGPIGAGFDVTCWESSR